MNKYISSIEYIKNNPDYDNIKDWENYKTNELIINDKEIKINGTNKNKKVPIFQNIIENNIYTDNIIYEDDKILILIPTINDTKDSPLNLISYCHFLILPKIRIFNAATLNKGHIGLLKHMKRVANKVMKSILVSNNNSNEPYVILNSNDIKSDCFKLKKNFKTGLGLYYSSAKKIHKSINLSVHLAPYHSVSYLHVHCYLKDLMLKHEDLNKNYSFDNVLNYFK